MQSSDILIKQLITNDNNLKSISDDLFEELVDEVLLGIYFEIHRAAKSESLFVDESPSDENKYAIIDKKGLDIFGQVPMKKQHECVCPNCQRNLAASRFAPHLEKCMGMGRNSSRIASKRIANTSVKNNDSDGDDYDNNADTDWSLYSSDSKKTRRKKDKNSNGNSNGLNSVQKKVNNSKNNKSSLAAKNAAANNGESASSWYSSDGSNVALSYESISLEEKKNILSQMCGVVSEHTKKMCTRSKRCPQHTEEQRKHIRQKYLESYVNSQNLGSNYLNQMHSSIDTRSNNESLIRIDNCVDNDNNNEVIGDSAKSIFDSREASPADSSSTNTSTSSVKRKIESINKSIDNRDISKAKSRNSSKKSKQQYNGVGNLSSSSSVSSGGHDHII